MSGPFKYVVCNAIVVSPSYCLGYSLKVKSNLMAMFGKGFCVVNLIHTHSIRSAL